jgi:hypothetical protein
MIESSHRDASPRAFDFSRAVAIAAALVLLCSVVGFGQTVRTRTVLADGWFVKQLDTPNPDIAALTREATAPDNSWLSAHMPAQVHDVLLQHKLIPDPHFSDNAAKLIWVAEKDWAYACKFRRAGQEMGTAFLEFQGLDTLATAYLNGTEIGRFDDMYRQYRVEVTKQLSAAGQDNLLLIVFHSPVRYLSELKPPHGAVIPATRYLRKAPPDFTNYLGARPNFIKVGIFRDVVLDAPGPAWIDDVWVRTELAPPYTRATLRARVMTSGTAGVLQYQLLDPSGNAIAHGSAEAGKDFTVEVAYPQLWWPRLYGSQPLYTLSVSLTDKGRLLDARQTKIGFRDVKLVLKDPATGEERFRFIVNGRPIYFRGGCWAPLEQMSQCWLPDRAHRLLDLAEQGRVNILRVWAEGVEPPAEFYDECDRRGIALWQDFFFANGMEPTDVPEYTAQVRAEITEMVRRLRNHPSLLLWVGGNENYMAVDFARQRFTLGNDLFLKIMPDIVAQMDPGRPLHPSSPYGGRNPNWPQAGDWHDYTTIQYEPESAVPLWASEVLRASTPSLESMRQFLKPEELWPDGWNTAIRQPGEPAWPPAWTYHSTGIETWDRIGAIERYPDASDAAELIRNLGTAHGEYLQERIERERRGVPDGAPDGNRRNWGNTVWRFNDPWPEIYSSVVDYYLEPKIAFYYMRRAYDPVLVSFERTPDWIAVWITNDSPQGVAGNLEVRHMKFSGELRGQMGVEVALQPGESKRVLNLTKLGILSLRDDFLHASFAGREADLLLTTERYLHLTPCRLTAHVEDETVDISTDVFARQVTLEMVGGVGAAFEDNYFDLIPGQRRTVKILNAGGVRAVRVRALNGEPFEIQLP